MANRIEFAKEFLRRLGYNPDDKNNIVSMLSWARSEFGGQEFPNCARNNPMATTYDMAGTTLWNSAGVRNYPDFNSGVHANVATLSEDHGGYAEIRDCLSRGADPHETCAAIAASVWGSHPSDAIVDTVEADVLRDAAFLISNDAASDNPPAPDPGPAPPPVGHVEMLTIRQGSRGEPVSIVQHLTGADPDGIFGPDTAQAVRNFQQSAGVSVDGVVGPHTWTALVQAHLGAAVDGVYGPETTQKVIAFQIAQGIQVDGIAGPETFARLAG